jgi:formyltetrahydrofolate synthetase
MAQMPVTPARTPRPIVEVAAELGLDRSALYCFGNEIAKIDPAIRRGPRPRPGAPRLVLVSAITPTAAGEGQDHHEHRPGRRAAPARPLGLRRAA